MSLKVKESILFFLPFTYFSIHLILEENIGSNKEFILQSGVFVFIVYYLFNKLKKNPNLNLTTLILSLLFAMNIGLISINILPKNEISFIKNLLKGFYFINLLIIIFTAQRLSKAPVIIALSSLFYSVSLLSWRYNKCNSIILIFILYIVFKTYYTIGKKIFQDKINLLSILFSIFLLIVGFYSGGFYNLDAINFALYLISGCFLFIVLREVLKQSLMLGLLKNITLIYATKVIFILLFIIFSPNFNYHKTYFVNNISGFHVSNIGALVYITTPILSYFIIKQHKLKIFYLILFLLSFIILYFSHSRASTIAVFVSLFFLLTVLLKKKIFQSYITYLLIIVFFFILFLRNFLNLGNVLDFTTTQERFLIWEYYINRTLHFSPLLGFGFNNEFHLSFLPPDTLRKEVVMEIMNYTNEFKANPHAHNSYVQFFLMSGILGLMSLLFILSYTIKNSYKHLKIPSIKIFAFSGVISFVVHAFFEYTLLDGWYYYLLIIYFTILLSKLKTIPLHNSIFFYFINVYVFVLFLFCFLNSYQLFLEKKVFNLLKNQFQINNFKNVKLLLNTYSNPELEQELNKIQSLQIPFYRNVLIDIIVAEYWFQKSLHDTNSWNFTKQKIEICLSNFPQSAFCHYRLAQLHEQKNDLKKAKIYYKLANQLDPYKILFKY